MFGLGFTVVENTLIGQMGTAVREDQFVTDDREWGSVIQAPKKLYDQQCVKCVVVVVNYNLLAHLLCGN